MEIEITNGPLAIYYWIAFAVSLRCLLRLPSRLDGLDNFGGSVICALFGFALWPLFVIAAYKADRATAALNDKG